MNRSIKTYKTISEVVKILGLENKSGKSAPTHTIRFWEKKFKQIKPKVLNGKRRYYDEKNIEILKKIYFLLKDQGMTISGAKRVLESKETLKLDETQNKTINPNRIKNKVIKISNILKSLKKK
tara:strand:- start:52 stop:420 length:369 start_codon:yes stop_codon:yes gene_type:complete